MLSTWVTYVNIYHTYTTWTNEYNIYTVNGKKTLEDLNLSLTLWAMKIGVGPLDSTMFSSVRWTWTLLVASVQSGSVLKRHCRRKGVSFIHLGACSLVFSSSPGCSSMLSCLRQHSWLLCRLALVASERSPLLVFCSLSPSSHSLGGFSSSESSHSCYAWLLAALLDITPWAVM